MARPRNRAPRRGVVLLVILSLLVLFALLGVTFVIVSGQYKRSAGSYMRAETYGDDWARQADTAMYIALRDTLDSANPLRTHSLLHDKYGHSSYLGTVSSADNARLSNNQEFGGRQLVDIKCSLTANGGGPLPTDANAAGYFSGCVLTFYRPAVATPGTNRLAGNSTRIVGSLVDSSGVMTLRVMRPTTDNASDALLPQSGDGLIINGKAFTGAGAGFNPATGKNDQPSALEPNRLNEDIAQLVGVPATPGYLYGGANENWDGADHHNIFLSATVPDPDDPTGIKHVTVGGQRYPCIIPSFHRPELVAYHQKNGSLPNRAVLRPRPNVTASANFPDLPDYVYGPWDVDNDGDGVADSVWIDLNLPVQTSADGRRYKPLFAMKIEDLDGRLNVNFHGNDQHYAMMALENELAGTPARPLTLADGSYIRTSNLPKGHGAGPAEVVLGNPATVSLPNPSPSDVSTPIGLFRLTNGAGGLYQQLLTSRYGADGVPGNGSSFLTDDISATKFFEIPPVYSATGVSTYHSPPDLRGQLAIAVDRRGQLMSDAPDDATVPADLRVGAAYRTWRNLDNRFTPAELERILRPYDVDVQQLPGRLEAVAGVLANSPSLTQAQMQMHAVNRRIVTTDSYDVPVAVAVNTATTGKEPRRDPVALLRTKATALTDAQLLSLVDRDFYLGIKMNLNRPLGDGQNNNQPGSVFAQMADEHEPYVDRNGDGNITQDDFPESKGAYDKGARLSQGQDLNGDGQVNAVDDWFARQQLAKHLYVLASLCVDTGIESGPTPERLNVQRQLAQWAVNVVDFRDADSIMTCFEYSPNPFKAWPSQCDGRPTGSEVVGADYGRVWGCERPELLLTESFFMHDRRTQDTEDEDPVAAGTQTEKGYTTDMMTKKDEDFDQRLLPQGSGFIEIMSPWQGYFERQPPELYNGAQGILLNARTPETTGSSPVWRLIIVKDQLNADPDKLDPAEAGLQIDPANDIERSVYFTDPSAVADDHGRPYYCDHDLAPLLPGRYAVVGSGPATPTDDKYVTYAGYRTMAVTDGAVDETTLADTRRFVFTPSTDPTVNQFEIIKNDHPTYPEPGNDVQPRIAAVINRTTGATANRRFSISEPVDGYPSSGTVGPGDLSVLAPVVDQPYDSTGPFKDDLMKNGTREQWRMVYLQRLANPLTKHDKNTNPYLTIDAIGADLTVFNGVTDEPEKFASADIPDHASKDSFESMERGEGAAPGAIERLLWKSTTASETLTPAEADPDHYFPFRLKNSLGYLNIPWQPYATAAEAAASSNLVAKGDPKVDVSNNTPKQVPFPWLTFNNRPFNSVLELMEVPAVRSSQLTAVYGLSPSVTDPYSQDAATYKLGHLFNFYYGPNTPPTGQVHDLYRIFEYLRIPSKYIESERMLNAVQFVDGTLGDNPFHPPYNWLSNFKDPGLVNINTIYSRNVFNAVLGRIPTGQDPTFDDLVISRRGGNNASTDIMVRDGNSVSDFAGAFRAPGTGDMGGTAVDPIEMTMLRKYPAAGPNAAKQGLPLFGDNDVSLSRNSARHPYFRHQTLHRLSNTLTTRSNVYACWITVGYFEVDGTTGQVGQELHADTGEVRRHRAFYMIDRTIPVGFQPGENHNVDRAILVRRYIE